MSGSSTGPLRRVLMVAYHFPPLAGSSGIQRTLSLVQHLPALGWQPLVLTTHPSAYERTSADQLADIPAGTVVERAWALDAARHLSFRGRYIGATARPDRWASWRLDGVRRGLQLIRRFRPQVIWSTYPIATAHVIAGALRSRTGLPWIADFRDPMAQDGYPSDPQLWQAYSRIEANAAHQATSCCFVTPGALQAYQKRYPAAAARMHLLENGYDEERFAAVEAQLGPQLHEPLTAGCLTLLHSGLVYPSERDPTHVFEALRRLHDEGTITPGRLRLRFRAAVAEDLLRGLAERFAVQPYIEICPAIPYREALGEMLRADGLLLLQAANCNEQVPAKLYEYLRARRPILCFSDEVGDTVKVLRSTGQREGFAQLDDARQIASTLARWVDASFKGRCTAEVPASSIAGYARAGRAAALATLLAQAMGAK